MMENLPEPYRSIYKELLEKVEITPGRKKKRKLFNNFVKKYTAIPDIWKLWIVQEHPDVIKVLKEKALTHFFDEEFLSFVDEDGLMNITRKNRKFSFVISYPYFYGILFTLIKKPDDFCNEINYSLSFPHCNLKNVLYYFEDFSNSFPSENFKKFTLLEKFYEKLMAAFDSDDSEKWFQLLLETKKNEIIIQNMEYYIAKKPYQKQAWKDYINFLVEFNFKSMLGVYSRYCRFFLDDEEMKKEYFQKVIQLHQNGEDVKIWFFDAKEILVESNLMEFFDFYAKDAGEEIIEISEKFESIKINYEKNISVLDALEDTDIWFMKEELNFLKTFDTNIFIEKSIVDQPDDDDKINPNFDDDNAKKCQIKWNNSNLRSQNFAFRENFLHYISQKFDIRQKLFQCCKYFFDKFRTLLCYRLFVTENEETEFLDQKLQLSSNVFQNDNDSNFLSPFLKEIRENMIITTSMNIFNSSNKNCFTQILKMFKMIHIKYLNINSQTINLQDLILLNRNSTLLSCALVDVDVFNADGSFSSVEDVITNLPTLKKFLLHCPNLKYTIDTAKKLTNMPSYFQLNEFMLMYATEKFQSIDFCNFLKVHASNNCRFEVAFNESVNDDYRNSFFQKICEFFDYWKPKHYAPSFIILNFPLYYPLP